MSGPSQLYPSGKKSGSNQFNWNQALVYLVSINQLLCEVLRVKKMEYSWPVRSLETSENRNTPNN